MENRELRLSYQEAIQLIRVGRYEEGLALLKAIDRERPNVKNVLYPMAVCCEKLGYVEEGIDLCDQLIVAYGHETARAIKARLELSIPYPEAQELHGEVEPPADREEGLDEGQQETPAQVGDESLTSTLETPEETAPEVASTAIPSASPKKRHKKPTWLVLLIALVAAAIVAALIHVFFLQGTGW